MKEHEEALRKATACFETFKIFFQSLGNILDCIVLIGPENLKAFQFSSIEEFQNLHKYVEFINNKVRLPSSEEQAKWEPDTGDWKIYKDNLEKFWISKLRSTGEFDYLVPKISLDWVQDFHISNVVKIKKPSDFL